MRGPDGGTSTTPDAASMFQRGNFGHGADRSRSRTRIFATEPRIEQPRHFRVGPVLFQENTAGHIEAEGRRHVSHARRQLAAHRIQIAQAHVNPQP